MKKPSKTRKVNALLGAIGAIVFIGGLVLGYARAFLIDWEFQVDYHQPEYEVFSTKIWFTYNFTTPITRNIPYQIVIKWDCCDGDAQVGYEIFLNNKSYSWFQDSKAFTTRDEDGDETTYCDFGIFEIYPVVAPETCKITIVVSSAMGGEIHVYAKPPPRERHPGLWFALNIIFPIIGIFLVLGGFLLGARSIGWFLLTLLMVPWIMIALAV